LVQIKEVGMKPTPSGWPRISTALYYEDASKAIDWLCSAFGFEVQMKVEGDGGRIEHSELVFDGGLIMVGEVAGKTDKFPYRRSPSQVNGVNTQNMMVYVDDVEAHCKQARAAGAKIHAEPKTTDYGEEYWTDRGYECEDIGGHHWWFYQRLRDPKPKA
jgi:uncharacterized glyoxalase superfamily protein PhnB